MENKPHHTSVTPRDLTFHLLERITNSFSEKHKIGSGGFGEVYKGVLDDGEEVAVKKLRPMLGLDDEQFKNEFNSLMKVQHQNIIRLVGYCYETRRKHVEHKGEFVFAKMEERALCFEYLQGGSLDRHLDDEPSGLDWKSRYKIIKGICDGLNYLHGEFKKPIFHLDLKPANILLDKNMVPKIADFGLSKLLGTTHTHITENIIGTRDYMPPEYISKRQISNKYDVFSLGRIIIEIIAGHKGYSKLDEMSPQQFIELVHKNWSNRIQTTSMPTSLKEVYCRQVKTCIEIALKCVEADKDGRPTIGGIIVKLGETETMIHEVLTQFSQESKQETMGEERGGEEKVQIYFLLLHLHLLLLLLLCPSKQETMGEERGGEEKQACLAKIGPWGGNGGTAHDIIVAPYRLESVTITSGVIVDSLAFSYIDRNGKRHTIGPWGGPYGDRHEIQFSPTEFIMEVSGTSGLSRYSPFTVLTSLKFVTNEGTYSFGEGKGEGTPFSIPMKSNCNIVGFFGRAGINVHGIGVYVKPNNLTLPICGRGMVWNGREDIPELEETMEGGKEDKAGLAMIGPWGGNGGRAHDIKVAPHRLETVTICDDIVVRSLAFSYSEFNGERHTVGPWGGPGDGYTIRLGHSEFLTRVFGTVGPFDTLPSVITSITFYTNVRSYGPFGQGGGAPFDIQMQNNGRIVGFFGHAESCLEALGVYIRTHWQ